MNRDRLFPVIAWAFALVAIGGAVYTLSLPPRAPAADDTSNWASAVRECDKQVPILLTTRDPLEFERGTLFDPAAALFHRAPAAAPIHLVTIA